MDKQTDHDLLIQIHEQLKMLRKDFDRISNGVGFPRCIERGERMKDLEEDFSILRDKDMEELKGNQRWIRRLLVIVAFSYIGVEILKGFKIF